MRKLSDKRIYILFGLWLPPLAFGGGSCEDLFFEPKEQKAQNESQKSLLKSKTFNFKHYKNVIKDHQRYYEEVVGEVISIEQAKVRVDIINTKELFVSSKGAKLAGLDFSDIKIPPNVQLEKADLRYTQLTFKNFRNANLQEALLWKANLEGSDFTDANLRLVKSFRTNFKDTILDNTDLTGAEIINTNQFRPKSTRNTILNFVDFSGTDLKDFDFLGTFIYETNIQEAIGITKEQYVHAFVKGAKLDSKNRELVATKERFRLRKKLKVQDKRTFGIE